MRVTICKRFSEADGFDAAHFLCNVPAGHKCARLHGHTYAVEVVCDGEPDDRGFVMDYAELAAAWRPIHGALDHRLLNEVPGLGNPTTEALAPWILERFVRALRCHVVSVRVYESSTTWCEARNEGQFSGTPSQPYPEMHDPLSGMPSDTGAGEP